MSTVLLSHDSWSYWNTNHKNLTNLLFIYFAIKLLQRHPSPTPPRGWRINGSEALLALLRGDLGPQRLQKALRDLFPPLYFATRFAAPTPSTRVPAPCCSLPAPPATKASQVHQEKGRDVHTKYARRLALLRCSFFREAGARVDSLRKRLFSAPQGAS